MKHFRQVIFPATTRTVVDSVTCDLCGAIGRDNIGRADWCIENGWDERAALLRG